MYIYIEREREIKIAHLPLLAQKCLVCTFLRRTSEYAIETPSS